MRQILAHGGKATYEDLRLVPEDLVAELIDGDLHTTPRPASRHVRATTVLSRLIGRFFDDGVGGPGGWWILDEPELHFGGDVLVPDIAGWRRERMPVFPDVSYFELAPDWVCETVSPQTAGLDRLKKLPRYARHGVGHAWIVDPTIPGVEVYRRDGDLFSLVSTHERADRIHAEPFEACEIDLSALWIDA